VADRLQINKWLVLVAIGIGTFMTALDTSVVNTILPVVSQSFKSDIASVEWVVTIYLLVLSGLLLSFGRLGDMRGHKPIYLAGFVIFVLGSVLTGLSLSVSSMVLFRALQAFGAAMIAANSTAILTKSFPTTQRGQALGLSATMTYLGLTIGPSFGGWLANQFSWRAVFYINVPVGLTAVILSILYIPKDTILESEERFDLLGAVTFMTGLTALLLGLNQGHAWGWTSLPILILLIGAVILLVSFLIIEFRVPDPMFDVSLLRRPQFSFSIISAILNYICIYTSIFLMPFYLIQGRGFNSAQAGLLLTAQPIIMAIIAPLSGTLSDKIGAQIPAAIGMAILATGLFFISRLGPQSIQSSILVALAVVGLGTGTFISPNNSALMGSAPRHQQGIAAGILATARNFGMVLGVGLAGAIFLTIATQRQGSGTIDNITALPSLYAAFKISFLVASGVGILGVFTSIIRGPNLPS